VLSAQANGAWVFKSLNSRPIQKTSAQSKNPALTQRIVPGKSWNTFGSWLSTRSASTFQQLHAMTNTIQFKASRHAGAHRKQYKNQYLT